jgi:glycosyltransferase involved in cell wall biosynthesis
VRIALDATYSVDPHPSGIAIYSEELLRGLAALYPEDQFLHYYRPKQWRKRRLPHFPNIRSRLLQWPFPISSPALFHALNQRVDWRPAPAVVSTFHDLFVMSAEYSTREFRARFTKQAKRAAQNSDLIIAVSQFTAHQIRDLLNVPASRIRVVPHGVHQLSLDLPLEREETILFVGTLQLRKNVIRLLEAFERACCPGWKLILAGAPGGYGAAEIAERIKNSRCRDKIEVTGYVARERLERLYSRASIFAFPSLDEGFGIPVLEAMAHGIPVLTSNRSALTEIAADAAMLVDPLDTDALAEQLKRLMQSFELREQLREKGIARARQFTWARTVRETYAVYRELSSDRPQQRSLGRAGTFDPEKSG